MAGYRYDPRMKRPGSHQQIAALLLSAAVLGACSGSVSIGSSDTLDTAKLEKAIRKEVDDKLPIRIGAVTCPDDIKIDEGEIFSCQVVIDDQELEIEVEQTDDAGNVDFHAVEAVLDIDQASEFVENYATDQLGTAASANCGEGRVLILEPGRTFQCNVSDGNDVTTATVTVKDVDGNVSVELD